jgi:hypothetical protein
LWLLSLAVAAGCANQTTFHTSPLGARIYVNGVLCGDSPCVYHTRYGFPDRIHLQLRKDGYQSADFYLDTEPPQVSYLLLGFGSYLFHTFASEYRFNLSPLPAVAPQPAPAPQPAETPAPPAIPPTPPAPEEPSPSPPQPEANPPGSKYWIEALPRSPGGFRAV